MFQIDDETAGHIEEVVNLKTDNFTFLVKAAGFPSKHTFENARFSEVDFRGSDLESFSFHRSDLRRCKWDPSQIEGRINVKGSMLGSGRDSLEPNELGTLLSSTTKASRWGDRFHALYLLVENFGLTTEIFDEVADVILRDKSVYFRDCALALLYAEVCQNQPAKDYSALMARNGNAQSNMFRIKKMRRFIRELEAYSSFKSPAYPNSVPRPAIRELKLKLQSVGDSNTD